MFMPKITKIKEDEYEITSQPCPDCTTSATLTINGSQLWKLNQGELWQNVLPDVSKDVRERFISTYCGSCFDAMFGFDDSEEDEND